MPDPDSVNCSHPNPHFLLQFVLLLLPDWVPLVYRVPGTPGVYYITVQYYSYCTPDYTDTVHKSTRTNYRYPGSRYPVHKSVPVPGYTKVRRPGIINREFEQSVTPPDKELE